MSTLFYKTTEDIPDGFVAEVYGHTSFIFPKVTNESVEWHWKIQNSNNRTHTGNLSRIMTLREGIADSSSNAEAQILQALDEIIP